MNTDPARLRVLQMLGARRPGGAENFFVRFAAALAEIEGVDVLCAVPKGSWAAGRLAEKGVAFETAGFGGRFDLRTAGQLKRIIADFQPNVAQSWMARASWHAPRGVVPVIGRIGGYYDVKYFKGLDHIVVIAPGLTGHVTGQGWPEERISLIPNFVAEVTVPMFPARAEIRGRFGIKDTDTALVIFGRLHENKAIDTAIAALSHLPETFHLVVAGNGPLEDGLRSLARESGVAEQVHFAGWVNDISPYFRAADICVMPSRVEAFGSVVLEAWFHEVPVIASRAGGPLSQITDEKDGLFFAIDDADALAAQIERVANNPELAESLAAAGRETYQKRYAKDRVIDAYLDLYRRLAKASKHRT